MKSSLNNPELEGVTPEYVAQLGKEWFEWMVDISSEEELFSLPKLEHLLLQKHQDGRREEAAAMLLKQIRRKFGQVPDEITEKVTAAKLELIETWIDNFVFANSLDDVFAS